MSTTTVPDFIYVTYIAAPAEKVWKALTSSEFTSKYFFDMTVESDWKEGSEVRYFWSDGDPSIGGKILAIDPPKHLTYTWEPGKLGDANNAGKPRVAFDILEFDGGQSRLTVSHFGLTPEDVAAASSTKVDFNGVNNGWPAIIASLKSLLETGKAMDYEEVRRAMRESASTSSTT
jgi:uncharacterized protein YndB with AHSA1/START domain